MNAQASIIESLFGIGFAWLFYWHFVRQAALDWLRQELFQIRGDLFDEVATRKVELEFGSPEYAELRRFTNSVIRFGYAMSPMKLLLVQIVGILSWLWNDLTLGEILSRPELPLDRFRESSHAGLIKKYEARIYSAMATYFVFTAPSFLLLVIVSALAVLVRHGVRFSASQMHRSLNRYYFHRAFRQRIAACEVPVGEEQSLATC